MRIALSFDDGPNNITTPQVLDLLEEHHIPASFFLIANNISPETEGQIRRAVSLGCDIENHSITHRPMADMPAEEVREEIRVCSEKIAAVTGESPRFFRPPFISISPSLFDAVDLTFISGIGCEDWVPEVSAEERIRRMLNIAADGVIYLLHDMTGNVNTVEALKVVIPELKKRGFEWWHGSVGRAHRSHRWGKEPDDRRWRKFHRVLSQTLRSELPSGQSRL